MIWGGEARGVEGRNKEVLEGKHIWEIQYLE